MTAAAPLTPVETIPEQQWHQILDKEQPTSSILTRVATELLARANMGWSYHLLPPELRFIAHRLTGEGCYNRNLRRVTSQADPGDINHFLEALHLSPTKERPILSHNLARSYALRHLSPTQMAATIAQPGNAELNEELHNMRAAIGFVTEAVDSVVRRLAQWYDAVKACPSAAPATLWRETCHLLSLHTMNLSNNQEAQLRQAADEVETLQRIAEELDRLEREDRLPDTLRDYTSLVANTRRAYYLRATCYERVAMLLLAGAGSDSHDAALQHLTPSHCLAQAYCDYRLARHALFQLVERRRRSLASTSCHYNREYLHKLNLVSAAEQDHKVCSQALSRSMRKLLHTAGDSTLSKELLRRYGSEPANEPREEHARADNDESPTFPKEESITSETLHALIRQGEYYIRRENLPRAVQLYERITTIEPKPEHLDTLANLYETLGDIDRAIATLERISPPKVGYWMRMASLYNRKGNYQQALLLLDRSAKQKPDDIAIQRELASNQHALGNYKAADRHYTIVRRRAPYDKSLTHTHYRLCVEAGTKALKRKQPNYKAASYYLDKAFSLQLDERLNILPSLIQALVEIGAFDKAVQHYCEAVVCRPHTAALMVEADLLLRLAEGALEQGVWKGVETILESTLAQQPGNERARSLLSRTHYAHAEMEYQQGNLENAIAICRQAIVEPLLPSGEIYSKLAEWLVKLGQQQETRDPSLYLEALRYAAKAVGSD